MPDEIASMPCAGAELEAVASTHIRLGGFRQILVWPLALDLVGRDPAEIDGSVEDLVADVARRFSAHSDWREIEDLLEHVAPPLASTHERFAEGTLGPSSRERAERAARDGRAHDYAEFVYFYDFLQRMLFADGRGVPPEKRPVRLWRHVRVREIDVTVAFADGLDLGGRTSDGDQATFRAAVDRLSVHLFDSGAAIVTLEVDFGLGGRLADDGSLAPLSLADALTICDHLRRVYPPYFADGMASLVPRRLSWRFSDADGVASVDRSFEPDGLEVAHRFVREGFDRNGVRMRSAPVAAHWRHILGPLEFSGYGSGGPEWRHVLDERIPVMTFLSVSGADRARVEARGEAYSVPPNEAQRRDFALVGRGDWVRLCYADAAGSDAMPYNPRFMDGFEAAAVYDRFAADPSTTSASRILFAGYHFAFAGSGWFFDNIVVHHFRRHYFQMMLLTNLELASLLVTSSRISEAVGRLRRDRSMGAARTRFIDELEGISEWFLTFVHRFRFSGVSNQIQPSELYERMRGSMKIDDLFTEVKEELEAAVAFNNGVEQRRITVAGERLTNVATIGATVGLALTFLGMSVLMDPIKAAFKPDVVSELGAMGAAFRASGGIVEMAIVFVTIAFFASLTLAGLSRLDRPRGSMARRGAATERGTSVVRAALKLLIGASIILASAAVAFTIYGKLAT